MRLFSMELALKAMNAFKADSIENGTIESGRCVNRRIGVYVPGYAYNLIALYSS